MKKKIFSILFALVLVLSFSLVTAVPVAAQSTWYVATTGSDTTGDGSEGNPWLTISHALTQVSAGDTIIVGPGTYVEYTGTVSAGCAIDIPWFAEGAGGLTIRSSGGAANTIIDCGWAGWGVQIVSNGITFDGFTVKNAYSVVNQVSAKGHSLSNLIITDFVNYGLGIAHGVECEFSNITIHTNDVSKSENRTVKGIDFIGYGSGGNNDCQFEDITIYDIETTGTYGTSFGIYWSTSSTFPDWDNTFTNITIHDLTAENWMACGIYIKGRAPGTTPYAIENTTFSGGSIYNIGGDAAATRGFYVDGGCKNLSITGFNIGCDKGIYFSHHAQEPCANVNIHYNNIVGTTEYGVQDYNGDNDVDATYNWWGDCSGPYHPTTNTGGLGDAVSDYVDYDPWLGAPCPVVAMSEFEIDRAKIDFKKKPDDDKVRVKGKLALDPAGDGVTISEDVTVTVGPLCDPILSETITMVEKGKEGEKWEYKRPKGDPGIIKSMKINWKNGKFDIRMDKADLTGVTNPVTIRVQIGDDFGEETILMTEKKHHWDYKAH